MNLELTTVEQPQLMQVAKESKIEFTKAEAYAAGYAPFMIEVNNLSQTIKELDRENPTAKDSKTARQQRLLISKVRTAAEAKKKEDKEIIVIEGRLIDGLYKVVENAAKLTESEYLEIEKHQERIESARLIKLHAERTELLKPFGEINQYVDLKSMDQAAFDKYLENEKLAFESRISREKQAELDRIEAERLAEQERVKAELAAKAEQERIRKENDELKKAAELQAEQLRLERIEAAKVQAEKDRLAKIESDKQAKIQAKLKAENNRIAAELKAKKDAEEKAREDEKQRIQQESADRIAKEKAASLAPDKAKVNKMYIELRDFTIPDFSTDEAKAIGQQVKKDLNTLLSVIRTLSNNLK